MNATAKVMKYELQDVVRSRWVIAYALFFLAITEGLLRFGGGGTRALLSLTNVVLAVIPLVSIVFGTMYLYNARDFIEMLLAQPVNRRHLFAGLYAGLALPLAAGFALGLSLPFALHSLDTPAPYAALLVMVLTGTALTFIFVALAFLIAVGIEDRAKGLGVSVVLWLLFGVVYDGLLLLIASTFADYPLEMPVLVLTLLNPVDVGRVALLMHFDIAALMGYTGAVFESFFGSLLGVILAALALLAWIIGPFAAGLYLFHRKDF